MMSSMSRSKRLRSARAPVPFFTACAASARNASRVTVRLTPSMAKSFVYCFTIAFFGSVSIEHELVLGELRQAWKPPAGGR